MLVGDGFSGMRKGSLSTLYVAGVCKARGGLLK